MVVDRQTFEYKDQVLIEKLKVEPPFRYESIFENSGCFIYFKEKAPRLLNAEMNVQIKSKEAVLMKCGSHFLDLLQETEDGQVEVIVFHLYPDLLKKLYTGELPALIEQGNLNLKSKVVAPDGLISKFIDSLEFYFQNPSLVNNDLLELKIKELILLLIQSKNIDSILQLVSELYSTKVVRIREVIELHMFSQFKLDELARLCGLSLSSFKREFKKEFNDSPTNYIISKRIEHAQKLLRMPKLTIGEIAYEVGFQDPLYFARVFKKKTNLTPTQYRLK